MSHDRSASVLFIAGLAALVLPSFLAAQITFERWYGDSDVDFGNSVDLTSDGGYVVAGSTKSFGPGGPSVYLVRTDSFGDTVWTRTYGGTTTDVGASVQRTFDGGFIVGGWTRSFGAGGYDAYLVKTDAAGDTEWTRTFGGTEDDECWSVQQTPDSGYILAGLTESSGADSEDIYLIKTDASGETLWTRMYGGPRNEYGSSVQPTRDGGYIVTGTTASFGAGDLDVYLIKTDARGDTMWTRTFGGAAQDWGRSVMRTMDGGYVVAGHTESFGAGGSDVYLIKTDSTGAGQWVQFHGDTTDEEAHSICQTADGGYIVSGNAVRAGRHETDVYLIRTDASGHSLWTRTYGSDAYDDCKSVQPTSDGGYIIAGQCGSPPGDVYLIKTDSDGRVIAMAEPRADPFDSPTNWPTIVRGVLNLGVGSRQYSAFRVELLDIAGRRVLSLKAGANDVHSLAPGVYFVRERLAVSGERSVVRRVVVTQ